MSSQQTVQEDQLLELLLQLKRTMPEQARAILNSQPQIAYALMAVMVNLNAINVEVVQKTLSSVGAGAPPSAAAATPAPVPPPVAPHPAIPTYGIGQPPRGNTPTYPPPGPSSSAPPQMQHQPPVGPRGSYPPPGPAYPPQAPGYPPSGPSYHQGHPNYPQYSHQTPPPHQGQYGMQHPGPGPYPSTTYNVPPPNAPAPSVPLASNPALQETLASIPEDQKALILRVVSLSPEEINKMPPQERASIVQLRASLGVPT
ncbi:hypothetical protein BXZ70DRAFT_946876 [Cristinia sonorae]|uniref:Cleavage stimulation factor subunit 2 hinge domain-containing protein n=1 Tax=Cristinia sonorae TaxID=1940300 RepID=A0A8K0UJI3_9AGAR|nr:hypothetical protein BXZ70DRAFT_946876 [Cristinia sonorae]